MGEGQGQEQRPPHTHSGAGPLVSLGVHSESGSHQPFPAYGHKGRTRLCGLPSGVCKAPGQVGRQVASAGQAVSGEGTRPTHSGRWRE